MDLESHILFAKISQWLQYRDVTNLKLLDDYAVSMGLSWLARPTKAGSNGDAPPAPSAKSKIHIISLT